jgi:hypothetical protein
LTSDFCSWMSCRTEISPVFQFQFSKPDWFKKEKKWETQEFGATFYNTTSSPSNRELNFELNFAFYSIVVFFCHRYLCILKYTYILSLLNRLSLSQLFLIHFKQCWCQVWQLLLAIRHKLLRLFVNLHFAYQ